MSSFSRLVLAATWPRVQLSCCTQELPNHLQCILHLFELAASVLSPAACKYTGALIQLATGHQSW